MAPAFPATDETCVNDLLIFENPIAYLIYESPVRLIS